MKANFSLEKQKYLQRNPHHSEVYFNPLIQKIGLQKTIEAVVEANRREGQLIIATLKRSNREYFICSPQVAISKSSLKILDDMYFAFKPYEEHWEKYKDLKCNIFERELKVFEAYLWHCDDGALSEELGLGRGRLRQLRAKATRRLLAQFRVEAYNDWVRHSVELKREGDRPKGIDLDMLKTEEMGVNEHYFSESVNELEISVRLSHVLKICEVECIGDVLKIDPCEYFKFRGVGKNAIKELIDIMKDKGVNTIYDESITGIPKRLRLRWETIKEEPSVIEGS